MENTMNEFVPVAKINVDTTYQRKPATTILDAHAHAFDGKDGYLTVAGIAETYGVTIREIPEDETNHPMPGWESWAWWYEVTGTRDQLATFMVEEGFEETGGIVSRIEGIFTGSAK